MNEKLYSSVKVFSFVNKLGTLISGTYFMKEIEHTRLSCRVLHTSVAFSQLPSCLCNPEIWRYGGLFAIYAHNATYVTLRNDL